MNILIFSALLIGSCRVDDPMATPVANTDYSIIDGDTVKTVVFKDHKKLKDKDPRSGGLAIVNDTIITYQEPKLHIPPAKDPDISKLKNNDDPDLKGKPIRYVAIGSDLTAGVRDGGYFNEGILTSYPNLIARQMKLKKFEQPLFDNDSYNGFGRKVRTGFNPTGGPVPKFSVVKNNSGIESLDEKIVKLKKVNKSIDNWAFPNLAMLPLDNPSYANSSSYLLRIDKADRKERYFIYSEQLAKEKYDFFSIEFDISRGSGKLDYDYPYYPIPIEEIIKRHKKLNLEGVLLNLPDIVDFPDFRIVNSEKYKKIIKDNKIGLPFTGDFELFPTSKVDSALSPKVHISLKPQGLLGSDVIASENIPIGKQNIIYNNDLIKKWGEKYGYPVVDLYSIYKKIIAGNYITDDGVRVNPNYPEGNFFSTDMRNPTAFGQAIIANEVIKTINAYYKLAIPLISTKDYLSIK